MTQLNLIILYISYCPKLNKGNLAKNFKFELLSVTFLLFKMKKKFSFLINLYFHQLRKFKGKI